MTSLFLNRDNRELELDEEFAKWEFGRRWAGARQLSSPRCPFLPRGGLHLRPSVDQRPAESFVRVCEGVCLQVPRAPAGRYEEVASPFSREACFPSYLLKEQRFIGSVSLPPASGLAEIHAPGVTLPEGPRYPTPRILVPREERARQIPCMHDPPPVSWSEWENSGFAAPEISSRDSGLSPIMGPP